MDIDEAKSVIKGLPWEIPVNLRGQPGVGKTMGVHQLAAELQARCYVFLACTMDPTDMSGIPMRTNEGFTEFAPPRWAYELSTEAEYKGPAIAFFDDLPTADEYVQAAFFRMVHERAVGNYHFRDNVRILAAGNRTTDKAGAREMPTPLRNRFLHLDVDVNITKWVSWALKNALHSNVVAYIRKQNNRLNTFDPKSNEYAFATPRSWHMVSDCLKALGGKVSTHFEVIAGLVGSGIAVEFGAFIDNIGDIKSPEEILKNPKKVELPKEERIDALYATISSLAAYVREHKELDNILGSFQYALRLHTEYAVILASDVNELLFEDDKVDEDIKFKVLNSPTYSDLANGLGKFLNF
jgi:hypothetical protein